MNRATCIRTAALGVALAWPNALADHRHYGRRVVVVSPPVIVAAPVVRVVPAPVVRFQRPVRECWDEVTHRGSKGRLV